MNIQKNIYDKPLRPWQTPGSKSNPESTTSTETLATIGKHAESKSKLKPINRTKQQKTETVTLSKLLIASFGNKLERHQINNRDTSHINKSIYHLLCHPFTFINAYAKISKNKGALRKGVKEDEEINKFCGQSNALGIARKFQTRTFQWNPVRRVMIDKPGKKTKRPIDTPTQENRIVQEAIRGILESIFEPEFVEFEKKNKGVCSNYGFRPNKSTWDAVDRLKLLGRGTTQVVEGDIVGAYNNVNHDILISILKRRIKDKLFLSTIKGMLESGVFFEGKHIHSLVGTPQGGIVSPLLFNIYMFEFDKFILEQHI